MKVKKMPSCVANIFVKRGKREACKNCRLFMPEYITPKPSKFKSPIDQTTPIRMLSCLVSERASNLRLLVLLSRVFNKAASRLIQSLEPSFHV